MAHPVYWLDYHARRTPGRLAIRDLGTGQKATYAQFADRVARLAGHLTARGVGRGDRVALLAQNSTRAFELLYACGRIGAILVPVNWRLSDRELQAVLQDFGPVLLVHDEPNAERSERLAGAVANHSSSSVARLEWTDVGGAYEAALACALPAAPHPDLGVDDPWVIIYTSGTTGVPKGAVHTFGSVRANIENSAMAGDVGPDAVSLTVLPTFHVAGLHLFANAALIRGGSALVMREFDAAVTLDLFQDEATGVTHFCGVPALFQLISTLPEYQNARLRPLTAAVGGSSVPRSMMDEWNGRGVRMLSVYGATEAGSTLLTTPPAGAEGKHAVGLPVVHAEAGVRSPDGKDVAGGEIGELWLRGPMVMKGYWNRPDKTNETVTEDGWLRTGDAAMVDDHGIFHIVDRWKDMYISGGENVYPAEVENVLYQHPEVVLASVVGVPDQKWGEAGHAFVVLRKPVPTEELRDWCRDHLARYKVPARFDVLEDLPRNATGKIQKNLLKASVA